MAKPLPKFRRLDPAEIVDTVATLHRRIENRFPSSGLGKVVSELLDVAKETATTADWIQQPNIPLRASAIALSVAIIGLLLLLLANIRQFRMDDFTNSVQALDASISSVVFISAAILFLLSCETRIKRSRALRAIHELRSLAHIIDMHQLTKDPEAYFGPGPHSRRNRQMTPFQLNRYLDYCAESLALISKVAALYVQGFQDAALMDAVDDVEDLTAGLSGKIWQKLTILERFGRSMAEAGVLPERTDADRGP